MHVIIFFSTSGVNLYATDADNGNKIIIENQLKESNHDYLGKLITYVSGKSADLVVWIVKKAREEHRTAIEWLNSHTDECMMARRNCWIMVM